ncbi:MAG: hypothetical protein WCG80_05115 [Spirochaetales bacterium]
MRWLALLGVFLVLPLAAEVADSLTVRVELDPVASQRKLDKDPRAVLNGPAFQLTPLFELVDSESGQRVQPVATPGGLWVAEFRLPPTDEPRVLHRLYVVPLPLVGSESRRAMAVLQELWAASDSWQLVRSAPAFAWGSRDPRYDAKRGLLLLAFPPRL